MPSEDQTSRPILRNAEIGRITQGTIFSCALAERYEDTSVFGLTITARCDVAQEKYHILNYLPVVSLADWLQNDGLDIMIDRERKEIMGNIRSIMKEASVSLSLIDAVGLISIAETHFPIGTSTRAEKARNERFSKHVTRYTDLSATSLAGRDTCLNWFRKHCPSRIKELITELSKHTLQSYYFLERLQLDEEPVGYVALLREVTTLQRNVVSDLARGISKEHWRQIYEPRGGVALRFDKDDFAMPISQLGSPTIEHIMQCFSNLFGRIGVADPSAAILGRMIATHCADEGEKK